jgi:enoyl-CoA hydratase
MTPVRTERAGGLAILTLDAPPLNLFDEVLIEGLEAGVQQLDDARALLIRADGRAVSAGVDVHVFDGLTERTAAALFHRLLDLTRRVEGLPFPVVFAAHGLCPTAAFELAPASDVILAAESARFGLVEAVIGITPAMGGTQRLAERAGAYLSSGVKGADSITAEVVGALFETADTRAAIRSFLEHGPGKASFSGR